VSSESPVNRCEPVPKKLQAVVFSAKGKTLHILQEENLWPRSLDHF
jgi:hypothetical protein